MNNEQIKFSGRIFLALSRRGLLKWIPDKTYLKYFYKAYLNKNLDIENPKLFSEKIQWLKLYAKNESYTEYVDKYAVRKYIEKTLGSKYLVPFIDVFDDVESIDFDKLPDKFVLKCTHGSRCNILCNDKKSLNIIEAKKKLKKWMKNNWFWYCREYPYKSIKPKILCEEFIGDGINPADDYKIYCLNGEPTIIRSLARNIQGNLVSECFYTTKWEKTDCRIRKFDIESFRANKEKPEQLNEMLEISKKLSKDITFLRVDLYNINGRVYFGEMTFFPQSGLDNFIPDKYNIEFGNLLKLPI